MNPNNPTAATGRKRFQVFVLVVFVLLAGFGIYHWTHREPSYDGKSLSEWLEVLEPDSSRSDEWKNAAGAIRAMGSNTLPYLIAYLQQPATQAPLRDKVDNWLSEHPTVPIRLPDTHDRPGEALEALKLLGPMAKPAIPLLAARLKGADGWQVAHCLAAIGPESIPAFTHALANPDEQVQLCALTGLGQLGPAAKETMPLLAAFVRSTNLTIANTAIEVITEIGEGAQAWVPEFEKMLTNANYSEGAAYALARLDRLEPLIRALNSSDQKVRVSAAVGLDPANKIIRPDRNPDPRVVFYYASWHFHSMITREFKLPDPKLQSRQAVTWLMGNMDNTNASIRSLIVAQLGNYGPAAWRATPALAKALTDADETVRQNAATALKKIDVQFSEGGIIRGPKNEKKIALVFTAHEFGEGGKTILDELAKHHAKASFFVTGDFVDRPETHALIKRIGEEGHLLGPHSDKHVLYCPWSGPKKTLITRDAFYADLQANLKKIKHALELARIPTPWPPVQYWLPAYEWYNEEIVDWSSKMGLTLINYTPGTRSNADYTREDDANFVSSKAIYDSIVQREQTDPNGLNGFFLMMHLGAGPGRTDKMHERFGELLDHLASKGYEFVRVDELLDPSNLDKVNSGIKPKA